jgi:hypothetical protein
LAVDVPRLVMSSDHLAVITDNLAEHKVATAPEVTRVSWPREMAKSLAGIAEVRLSHPTGKSYPGIALVDQAADQLVRGPFTSGACARWSNTSLPGTRRKIS